MTRTRAIETSIAAAGALSLLFSAALFQGGCSSDSADAAGASGTAGAAGTGGETGDAATGGSGATPDAGLEAGPDGGCPGGCDDHAACTTDTCVEGTCEHTLHAGHCLIDGVCIADGAPDPQDVCRICNVADAYVWSPALDCGLHGACESEHDQAVCVCQDGYVYDDSECVDARFGTGLDGSLHVVDETHVIESPATFLIVDAEAGDTAVEVDDDAGFSAGDQILVINLQGADAGRWEVAEVALTDSDVVSLRRGLQHRYPASDRVVVMRIAVYEDVIVEEHGVLHAPSWDGQIGGVLAMKVRGRLTVGGRIDMQGRGYAGGSRTRNLCDPVSWGRDGEGIVGPGEVDDPLSNHGGGGGGTVAGCLGTSGGGGGHATPGSDGACGTADPELGCFPPGMGGGAYASYDLDGRVFFGGGGGGAGQRDALAGNGARGGGIVLVWAKEVVVDGGLIRSGGGRGADAGSSGDPTDSGGGGGAGGSVLVFTPVTVATDFIDVSGGEGGDGYPLGAKGGAGGDGLAVVEVVP